jgi:hypothetical protein
VEQTNFAAESTNEPQFPSPRKSRARIRGPENDFDIRQVAGGFWEVYEVTTGEMVTVDGWPLSRLAAEEARRSVHLLREKMILPDRAFSALWRFFITIEHIAAVEIGKAAEVLITLAISHVAAADSWRLSRLADE